MSWNDRNRFGGWFINPKLFGFGFFFLRLKVLDVPRHNRTLLGCPSPVGAVPAQS